LEKFENLGGNLKVIASLSNIKMKDIVLNKDEGFLISLSQGFL